MVGLNEDKAGFVKIGEHTHEQMGFNRQQMEM